MHASYNHCPSCDARFDKHDGDWSDAECSQCDAAALCWICPACGEASCEACAVKPCVLTDESLTLDPECIGCGIDVPAVNADGRCPWCADRFFDDGDDFSEAGYRAAVGID